MQNIQTVTRSFAISHEEGQWQVVERVTGAKVGEPQTTRFLAFNLAKQLQADAVASGAAPPETPLRIAWGARRGLDGGWIRLSPQRGRATC